MPILEASSITVAINYPIFWIEVLEQQALAGTKKRFANINIRFLEGRHPNKHKQSQIEPNDRPEDLSSKGSIVHRSLPRIPGRLDGIKHGAFLIGRYASKIADNDAVDVREV